MDFNRILLRFSKEGDASTLSHRDLMRLFERALRRAALPVRMTQGFNPHPRMAILLALPVGVEAEAEPVLLEFEPPADADAVRDRLAEQMPRGIRIGEAEALPPGVKPRPTAAAYEAELPGDAAVTDADVERFLARDAIVVERVTPKRLRTIDLRPALTSMSIRESRLSFGLRVGAEGTPKPTEVVAALLESQPELAARARLRRTRVELDVPPAKDA